LWAKIQTVKSSIQKEIVLNAVKTITTMMKENNVSKLVLHVPLGMNKLDNVKPVSQDMENLRRVFAAKFQSGTATLSVLST